MSAAVQPLPGSPDAGQRVDALSAGLLRTLARSVDDVEEAFAVMETLLLGCFLLGDAGPRQVTEHLDVITQRVIERHAAAVAAGGGA